jgi:hypothetical protein
MRRGFHWIVIGLAFLAVAPLALAEGNADFLLGSRGLDKDFWEPLESQRVLGAAVDFGGKDRPANLAAGLYVTVGAETEDDLLLGSTDMIGAVSELSFGVLKTGKPAGSVRPFLGGEMANVGVAAEINPDRFPDQGDHDSSLGAYLQGGVSWRLGSRFSIGVDTRALVGSDVTLSGAEGDADHLQLGMVLG